MAIDKPALPASDAGAASAAASKAAASRASKRLNTDDQPQSAPHSNTGTDSRGTKSLNTEGEAGGGKPVSGASKKIATGAQAAQKAARGPDGLAADMAGGAARGAVTGKGDSAARNTAGRYVGAATSGAVEGGIKGSAAAGVGAAPGAAAGAAKGVAQEGVKDLRNDLKKGEESKVGRTMAMAAPVVAAPPAAFAMSLVALGNFLKSLFFQALAVAANAGKMLFALAMQVVGVAAKAIAAPFLMMGAAGVKTIAGVFGIGMGAGAVPVAAVASALVPAVLVTSFIGGLFTNQDAKDDALFNDEPCVATAAVANNPADTENISASVEENAKIVYSVFKTWGMPDVNIAGILGNWSRESGIDPTSVESIFDEPYTIGPRKQAAWDGNFTHIPGQSHGGIGLGQWSNGRTIMLLDYATSKNVQWYTLPTQLAFMVQGDNPSDAEVVRNMISVAQPTPSAAAYYFHDNWERSADTPAMAASRAASAEQWFARMSGWTVDPSVSGSIEEITGGSIGQIETIVQTGSTVTAGCTSETALGSIAGLTAGGLSEQEANALMVQYNAEGHQFLWNKYQGGGPGQCNGNYVMNCVSFSTYFYNRYTSLQQYAPGNGRSTATSIASLTGKTVSKTPTVYSVFSHGYHSAFGHTGVVLRIENDRILVGEAGYCMYMGRTRWIPNTEWQSQTWDFVDLSDLITNSNLPGGT